MNLSRLVLPAVCLVLAAGLSSCSMFGSKSSSTASAPVGAQEFDPYSNTWKPAGRVVVPPPSQPNADIAAQKEALKKENSMVKKVGRGAGEVGKTITKPLKWIPFVGGKKGEASADPNEVDPSYSPAAPQ
ncbi:MAG: hypothetical protein ACAI34_09875 [Verrucomicrobium sp.]